jgi:hypothetical protein
MPGGVGGGASNDPAYPIFSSYKDQLIHVEFIQKRI